MILTLSIYNSLLPTISGTIYVCVCVLKCSSSFHNIPAEAEKGKVISRLYNYTHRFPFNCKTLSELQTRGRIRCQLNWAKQSLSFDLHSVLKQPKPTFKIQGFPHKSTDLQLHVKNQKVWQRGQTLEILRVWL